MKLFLLFLLLVAPTAAHTLSHGEVVDPYAFQLRTVPERLEPGATDIILTVTRDGVPLAGEPIWIRLSDRRNVYIAGNFVTDESGTLVFSYYFNGPGTYTLAAEVQGARSQMPLHVHGQYILLFGFLAAVFIAIALLFDKKSVPGK